MSDNQKRRITDHNLASYSNILSKSTDAKILDTRILNEDVDNALNDLGLFA